MKAKTCLIIIALFYSIFTFAQEKVSIEDNGFKNYVLLFPEKTLPFYALWDYSLSTSFEVPLNKIPKKMEEQFICNYGINCSSDYCNKEKVFGFSSLARFNISSSFFLLLITFDADAGCDEKWYLVTYSNTGEMIDNIIVFGKTYSKLPSENDPSRVLLRFESSIKNNQVDVTTKTINYKQKTETITNSITIYKITETGYFKITPN